MECSMCGGPLDELGGLGSLMWYRCRNCGMECNKSAKEVDDEDTTEAVPSSVQCDPRPGE